MLEKLIQAAVITFLLHLAMSLSPAQPQTGSPLLLLDEPSIAVGQSK